MSNPKSGGWKKCCRPLRGCCKGFWSACCCLFTCGLSRICCDKKVTPHRSPLFMGSPGSTTRRTTPSSGTRDAKILPEDSKDLHSLQVQVTKETSIVSEKQQSASCGQSQPAVTSTFVTMEEIKTSSQHIIVTVAPQKQEPSLIKSVLSRVEEKGESLLKNQSAEGSLIKQSQLSIVGQNSKEAKAAQALEADILVDKKSDRSSSIGLTPLEINALAKSNVYKTANSPSQSPKDSPPSIVADGVKTNINTINRPGS